MATYLVFGILIIFSSFVHGKSILDDGIHNFGGVVCCVYIFVGWAYRSLCAYQKKRRGRGAQTGAKISKCKSDTFASLTSMDLLKGTAKIRLISIKAKKECRERNREST